MAWSQLLEPLVISSLSSLLSGGHTNTWRKRVDNNIFWPFRNPSIHTGPVHHSRPIRSVFTLYVHFQGINLFVCNMALSDMMMCLTAAPLSPITSFTGRWFLGRLPCVILPACQVASLSDWSTLIGRGLSRLCSDWWISS